MAPGMQMVAEPVATRIEPAGGQGGFIQSVENALGFGGSPAVTYGSPGMVMEQQPVPTRMEAMPATTYAAPASTYGAQPGVMMGSTTYGQPVQQEGFLQQV